LARYRASPRSGHRPASPRCGSPPTVRIHVPENAPSPTMSLTSELRTQLVQTIAMVELMGEQWLEPPNLADLHLSTLLQQVLAVVAQNGGASAASLHRVLCTDGPFRHIDTALFAALLRSMAGADLLAQGDDGLLLPGTRGDRLINHYTFYAVFHTPQEFRLVDGTTTLGTLPVERPIRVGSLLIFAGRRWRVLDVDAKLIQLTPSSGGKPPPFTTGVLQVADTVRKRMRAVYRSDHQPAFLDEVALTLLQQGRDAYTRLQLTEFGMVHHGSDTIVIPWRGDTVMNTLAVVLQSRGLEVGHEGVLLTVAATTPTELQELFRKLAAAPPPDPIQLAATVAVKAAHKYDQYLSAELLARAYAARSLDIPNTWHALRELAELPTPSTTFPRRTPASTIKRRTPTGRQAQLGHTPFAVLDVETTGFDAAGADRVIEIAIVRLSPDAEPLDRWTTLVDPNRSPGPTHVHGLTADDLRDAPTFAEIADTILAKLDGAVIVAHNADYDLRFLAAEFQRIGRSMPEWPSLCTMALAYRLGSAASRRLSDLCIAEGLTHRDQHTALADTEATARLFGVYLRRAKATGARDFADMGISSPELPTTLIRTTTADPRTKIRTSGPATGTRPPAHAPATGNPRVDVYLDTIEHATTETSRPDTESQDRLAEQLDLTPADIAFSRQYLFRDQDKLTSSSSK
jgi:ATP-dependent helicase Lhr and Lhr-like helicase